MEKFLSELLTPEELTVLKKIVDNQGVLKEEDHV
jgi:hypothetical protein